jgi:uncharacterized protein YbjT (DUF2867 family)
MAKKVIAVVGATGAQGSGVVRGILEDVNGGFSARALTRKVDGEKAQALRAQGVDVVAADLDDVESLTRAFEGAYGAFCVTNFWEHFSPEKEMAQAKNLAVAAQRAGLQHVVWSTLEDTRLDVPLDDDRMPTLQGRYKVPHFDAKGEADHFFTALKVPTTFFRVSFYWENMIYFGLGPKRGNDGVITLSLPMGDKKISGIAAADIGRCAYGIFKEGTSLVGEVVGVAGDENTGGEIAAILSAELGETVRYAPVTPAMFRSFGFPGAEDLGNMFQYYQEFERELAATRSVERSRELYPQIQTFAQWAKQNAARMPVEVPA